MRTRPTWHRRIEGGHPFRVLRTIRRILVGAPIPTHRQEETRLPKLLALPVFSSDAISSVAYATQEILLALGAAGLAFAGRQAAYNHATWGVTLAITLLLVIVAASYRQTIFAYPSGGGSYIVSKENLGVIPGLIAAAALLIDYVLTVAVSIASGVQNLVSTPALSFLARHTELVCLFFVLVLLVANLRGLKEAGALFALPTYLFIGLSLLMIFLGGVGPWFGWKLHPEAVNQSLPAGYGMHSGLRAVGLFVLLRAFANGCSAMTGTEAISNGIPAFRKPESSNASTTLLWMAGILGTLFVGISWLTTRLHVVYWAHHGQTAPAVIDQLSGAVFGRSGPWVWLYYTMQFATAAILVLAANTSFADFPRLASILARDRFAPRQLANRGDRLVFDGGIILLSIAAILLLAVFRGSVDRLIPLYALGVFTAFTLSQSGMVVHWWRERGTGWLWKAVVNGIGAVATGIVFLVILVEKGPEGAWVVAVLAAAMVVLFLGIRRHYVWLKEQLALPGGPQELTPPVTKTLVLVPGAHRGVLPALKYARLLGNDMRAVHVEIEPERTQTLREDWERAFPDVPLVILSSPYRSIIRPLIRYLNSVEREEGAELLSVVIPEFFTDDWWDALLHNAVGPLLKIALLGRSDVVVTNVRYHVRGTPEEKRAAQGLQRRADA